MCTHMQEQRNVSSIHTQLQLLKGNTRFNKEHDSLGQQKLATVSLQILITNIPFS